MRAWQEIQRIRYWGITHYHASAYGDIERFMKAEKPDFLQINFSLAARELLVGIRHHLLSSYLSLSLRFGLKHPLTGLEKATSRLLHRRSLSFTSSVRPTRGNAFLKSFVSSTVRSLAVLCFDVGFVTLAFSMQNFLSELLRCLLPFLHNVLLH